MLLAPQIYYNYRYFIPFDIYVNYFSTHSAYVIRKMQDSMPGSTHIEWH